MLRAAVHDYTTHSARFDSIDYLTPTKNNKLPRQQKDGEEARAAGRGGRRRRRGVTMMRPEMQTQQRRLLLKSQRRRRPLLAVRGWRACAAAVRRVCCVLCVCVWIVSAARVKAVCSRRRRRAAAARTKLTRALRCLRSCTTGAGLSSSISPCALLVVERAFALRAGAAHPPKKKSESQSFCSRSRDPQTSCGSCGELRSELINP